MPKLYAGPKVKLRAYKKKKVKVKGEMAKNAKLTTVSGKKLKLAPVKMKKAGKIIRIKTKGYSEPTRHELKVITKETMREGLEMGRLKRERYLQKIIKGLK